MIYLCALLVPPLYFVLRQKWGAFLLNCVFCGLAVLCVLSMIGIVVAPFFWLVAVVHAMWALRRESMEEHATLIATKMAEKMKGQ